jgi:hypothetical protein
MHRHFVLIAGLGLTASAQEFRFTFDKFSFEKFSLAWTPIQRRAPAPNPNLPYRPGPSEPCRAGQIRLADGTVQAAASVRRSGNAILVQTPSGQTLRMTPDQFSHICFTPESAPPDTRDPS